MKTAKLKSALLFHPSSYPVNPWAPSRCGQPGQTVPSSSAQAHRAACLKLTLCSQWGSGSNLNSVLSLLRVAMLANPKQELEQHLENSSPCVPGGRFSPGTCDGARGPTYLQPTDSVKCTLEFPDCCRSTAGHRNTAHSSCKSFPFSFEAVFMGGRGTRLKQSCTERVLREQRDLSEVWELSSSDRCISDLMGLFK